MKQSRSMVSVVIAVGVSACGARDRAGDADGGPQDAWVVGAPDARDDADARLVQANCVGLPSTCGPDGAASCCDSPLVPGGTFDRGFDRAGDALSGSTTFPATLRAYRLDAYEVTVARFRAFVQAGQGTQAHPPAAGAGAHAFIDGSGWDPGWTPRLRADTPSLVAALACDEVATWTDQPGPGDDRPINCVTWFEAMAFCAWDGGYLPTEAEWNFAASGGDEQRAFPWSSPAGSTAIDPARATYYDGEGCVGDADPDCTVADLLPVGTRPAGNGRWGQADLAGNAYEWTFDAAGAYPTPCADCANLGPILHRELRGGSFASSIDGLRTGFRIGFAPQSRISLTGIRCARAP